MVKIMIVLFRCAVAATAVLVSACASERSPVLDAGTHPASLIQNGADAQLEMKPGSSLNGPITFRRSDGRVLYELPAGGSVVFGAKP